MTTAICVVRHGYYPEDPRIFKEVRALCEANYAVDVLCLKRPGEKSSELVGKAQVYRLSHQHQRRSLLRYFYEYGLSFSKMLVMVTALHFRRSYDCIQVNTLPDPLVFVTIIPRLLGARVLLDMHEPTPELFITKYGENNSRLILKLIVFMEQLSIKYADAVLTVNEILRQRFIERGAHGHKIRVVRNVPDEGFSTNILGQSLTRGLTLLTHGTILEIYGQEVIVRALSLLRDKVDELQLFIVGDGENAQQVYSLIEELGCSDIVTFTGRVPFSRIGEFINAADIGVVPLLRSPWSELCQPNKMFEYIACRKPVIVSRLKAIEESFDDSCVMFFEPGNHEDLARSIFELYNDPQKRRALADNAYRRYEKMRWRETKRTYLKVIEDLTDETKELSSK